MIKIDQRWFSINGITDIITQMIGGTTIGVIGGLGKGMFSGLAGKKPKFKGGPLKRLAQGLGWGIGATLGSVGKGVITGGFNAIKFGIPLAGMSGIKDFNWMSKLVGKSFDKMSVKATADTIAAGTNGIAGRIMKPGFQNAISLTAIGLGALNGAEKADYNIGLRTLTNGIMDTEGVTITPGQVSPNFTPVTIPGMRKGLRDTGVSGDIGFALHRNRNNLM